jgi:phage regulator Rha-like protein
MKKNKLVSIESLRMTSREIATYCDARHDNVLKTIQRLLKVGVLHCSNPKKYISSTGRQSIEYECDRTDSIVIVARIDPKFMRTIVERWQELEIQVKQLQEKSQIRQVIKQDFKLMNDALKTSREHLGKETKGYHYSTESDLLYLIVLGKRSRDLEIERDIIKDIRNNLSLEQIKALEHLQRANTTMLDMGLLYDERKVKLTEMHKKFYIKSLH